MGNKTELQGTEVQAKDISFVKNNPNGAGELILGGSIDTKQTSHTEKDVTAGVWQSSKGNGSTAQTLNQTQLNGNVTFDGALKISAQIPDTKGGTALKSQIQALAVQSPGLDYLNQLSNNPNVQWVKVALANEHWSYDQSGLTPAGAALLSIAVAAYTGGKVAPQEPIDVYPGNGNQIYYDYPADTNRLDYVRPTGPTMPLPPASAQ